MTTPIGDIPDSSIPAVRAYLYAQLQALATPDPADPSASLLVCLDGPNTDLAGDIVSVGDVRQEYAPFQTTGSGGPGWLSETYTVTVEIQVTRGTDDSTVTFARAQSLARLVVALVRSDPSLGGAVLRARPATADYETAWAEGGGGRQTFVTLAISCFNPL